MADRNYEIATKIGWTSDDAKLKDVVAQLEKLNATTAQHTEQQRKAKTATDQHGDALDGLGGKAAGLIAQFVGVAAAVRFAWSAFSEAVSADKVMAQLTANARLLGNATDAQVAGLKEWVEWLERASGMEKEQLIPATITLMGATKDLTSAQLLVEVAAGAATRGVGEFEGNVGALARAMETGTLRGFSPFVQMLREMLRGGEDVSKLLPELVKKFGDAGSAVHTTAMELARQKVMWHDSKEEMGRAMEGLTSVAFPVIKGLSFGLGLVSAGILKLIGFFASLPAAMKGNFIQAYAIQKEWSEKATKLLEGVTDAWAKPAEGAKRSEKEQTDALARIAKLFAAHGKKMAEETSDELSDAARNTLKSEELRLQIAEAYRKKKLQRVLQAKEEELRIEKDAEKKIEQLRLQLWNYGEKLGAKELVQLTRRMEDTIANEKMIDDQLLELTRLYEEAKTALLGQQIADNTAANKQGMEDAAKFALSQFGNVKAVAVAQALINTYEGATKALSAYPPPWSFIAAAAVIAAGLKQVSMIQSSEPGVSGGASSGAAVAAPAGPMVYTGAPAGSAPSSMTNVNQTTNQPTQINISTLTGDGAVQTARQFQRILRPGSRSYDRGIVNRRATTIGGSNQ